MKIIDNLARFNAHIYLMIDKKTIKKTHVFFIFILVKKKEIIYAHAQMIVRV